MTTFGATMSKVPLVAVTGGTGFIGHHIVAALAQEGWHLRLLARGTPPSGWPAEAEVVRGDLADRAALDGLVRGADAVVHAAGLTKALSRTEFDRVNRDGTGRLAAAVAAAAPDARCVHLSSLAAREPRLSLYASSKHAGEREVLGSPAGAGRWAILRPAIVYGPGDREGLALRHLATQPLIPVPRAPEPCLTLVHVSDVARAVTAFCRAGPLDTIFEVSDARREGYRWREWMGKMAAVLDCRPPRFITLPDTLLLAAGRAVDIAAAVTSRPAVGGLGKMREFLHRNWRSDAVRQPPGTIWSPCRTIDDGLRDTAAWWASLGLATQDPSTTTRNR